ncbi:MAG: hypothetical protein H6741_18570 [Alphaproteobacteria bacterium]|nr:hypothetical protein [Alphaproteobacteria bacterium]MCB9794720.1 hypothetical protein [Alphaproteobacteria bacterium]
MSAAPRPAVAWGLLALALLVSVWGWPLAPTQLLGHPAGELSNHLAMLWRAGAQLQGVEGPLGNLPEGSGIPLMDPINLPLYLAGAWLHPALGYGLMVCADLALAGLGAAALARALGGSRVAALTAAVAGLSAPFLSGVVSFGITESLPVGWLGLHLAAAIRAAERGDWRWWGASGLALAAFTLAGWYHAVFAVPVELGLLLWLAVRRDLRGLAGGLAQGLLAAALLVPRLLQHLAAREVWADRWHPPALPPEGAELAWRHTPAWGADLLNLGLPSLAEVPVSKSVYIGVVVIALAAIAGRRARLALGLAAPLLLLSLGLWLRVGGQAIAPGIGLPARWLTALLPPLEGLSHWHRALGPATVLLAAAAGLGAERLAERRPALAWALPLLVLFDATAFSQTPWPRSLVSAEPPAAYAALQGEGGLVELPFDNAGGEFDEGERRIYERWQARHGHAIAENYEGPDALLRRSRLIAAADGLCGLSFTGPRAWRPPQDLRRPEALVDEAALRGAVKQLGELGVGWVALHRGRARTPEPAAALLRRALGAPVASEGGVEIFQVPPPGAPARSGP